MSAKERVRLEAFGRVKRGELRVTEAAALCGLSVRQARRAWKRFKASGDAGLLHGLRGRAGNRRLSEDLRERIVKRHQERYADFGPTLACEKLAGEGFDLPHEQQARVGSLLAGRLPRERYRLWQNNRPHHFQTLLFLLLRR